MQRLLIALATLIVSLGVLTVPEGADAQGYVVQVGDRLDISVLEDPGLNRTVLVRPDGRITMPLAGSIVAAGSSPEALQTRIQSALSSQFVQPPTVTVSLVSLGQAPAGTVPEGALARVYVLGQVGSPGPYEVALPMDILQVLAIAGGPATFAARKRIQVRRRGTDGETLFLFDYDSIERGEVPSTPITIADGDVILVPERRLFE